MPGPRVLSLLCTLLFIFPAGTGQTPPPASGDWSITDSTTISNQTINLDGNLVVKSGGRLILDNVVLKMNCASNGQYMIKVESGGGLVLNGTTVTCPTDGLYYKFQIYGDADIENSTIEKVWGIQASFPYWVGGIEIYSDNVSIVGSTVRNCFGNGIMINGSSPEIRNCFISNNGWRGISCCGDASPYIVGNNITNSERGVVNLDLSCATIENNNITDNTAAGIMAWNYSRPFIYHNNVSGSRQGIQNRNWSIPKIINNTISNIFQNGIINFDEIDVTIETNRIDLCMIAGIRNGNKAVVRIVNNTICESGDGIYNLDESNVIMENNRIEDNSGCGILNGKSSNSSVTRIFNNTIHNTWWNGISNHQYTYSTISGNNITCSGNSGITCYGETESCIESNTISGTNVSGILVNNNAIAIISNNTISNSTLSGVNCASFGKVVMVNNTISGKTGHGITASGSSGLVIKNSTIHSNWMALYAVDSSDVVAENNTFEDNEYGIMLANKKAYFASNTVSGGAYGFRLVGCSPTLEGNRIFGTENGIQLQNSSAVINGSTISSTRVCSIDCSASSSPVIINTTITSAAGGVDLRASDVSNPTVLNTIFDSRLVRLYDTSTLKVEWYLQLDVKDSKSRPLGQANISIGGPESIHGVTDSKGTIGWLPLLDRTLRTGSETKAMYRIDIEKYGDTNSHPNITVNRSESRDIRFDFSPIVSFIPSLYLNENMPFVLELSSYIDDRDHDDGDLIISLSGDSAFDRGLFLDANNLTFNYSLPVPAAFVTFDVTDGLRNASGRFMVHVNETNDPPVFKDPGTLVLTEDEPCILDLGQYLADEEDKVEELKVEFNSSYASLHGLEMHLCYPDGVLADQIPVTVTDRGGAACQRILHVNIIPVNDAPFLTSIPEIRPFEEIELIIDLSGLIKDPDSNLTDITVRTDSRYCRVDGQKLIFNYTEGVLNDVFNLTLSDGIANRTYSFNVQVMPVNDPPVLTIPSIGVVAGVSRTVDLSDLITDPDTPRSNLSMWSSSPHVSVNGFNITISYPKDTASGTKRITLRLSDGTGTYSYEIPVNVTASKVKEKLVPASNLYLYILLPLAIIGTAAGILLYRRNRYGWYKMRRAMLVNTDGRLLAHAGDMGDAEDQLLVSSMLTAVQQFIEEVMKKEKAGAIKEFMYEDLKIAVERGVKIYLAVFIEGYATEHLRKLMKAIVTEMEMKYGSELANWDGRTTQESFITEAGERLKILMDRK